MFSGWVGLYRVADAGVQGMVEALLKLMHFCEGLIREITRAVWDHHDQDFQGSANTN